MPQGKHLLGMPKGKHLFGTAKVGEKGQLVIPKEARTLFNIKQGDTLLILGDDENGIFITKPDVMNKVALEFFEKIEEKEK